LNEEKERKLAREKSLWRSLQRERKKKKSGRNAGGYGRKVIRRPSDGEGSPIAQKLRAGTTDQRVDRPEGAGGQGSLRKRRTEGWLKKKRAFKVPHTNGAKKHHECKKNPIVLEESWKKRGKTSSGLAQWVFEKIGQYRCRR